MAIVARVRGLLKVGSGKVTVKCSYTIRPYLELMVRLVLKRLKRIRHKYYLHLKMACTYSIEFRIYLLYHVIFRVLKCNKHSVSPL